METLIAFVVTGLSFYFLLFLLVIFEHRIKQIYGEYYHYRLDHFDVLSDKQFIRAGMFIMMVGAFCIIVSAL